jgi:hypothetical protein
VAPATAAIEYATPLWFPFTAVAPEIPPGVAGAEVTEIEAEDAAPVPQVLEAVTLTLPEALPKFTEMEVVPCPAVMVAPEGTDHV